MANVVGMDAMAGHLRDVGVAHEGPLECTRLTPGGGTLKWKLLRLVDNPQNLLPACFTEWDPSSRHPAEGLPSGAATLHFELASPQPEGIRMAAENLRLQLRITRSDEPELRALIAGQTSSVLAFLRKTTRTWRAPPGVTRLEIV
jgi:hypothetical protein